MKKIITTFILISILKGILLYLIILLGNLIPSFPGIIRFLMFVLFVGLIDWKIFSIISQSFEKRKWIKLCIFSFVTFIMVLFITGPLFAIHNKMFDIQPKGNAIMPNLLPFFIFGLVISLIITTIWTKRK
jgi:hypothetical protein